MAADQPVSDDFSLQSWQMEDGLPGNAVNGVLQDQNGFIWLATIGGLVRFDGATFKAYSSPLIARGATRNILALAETTNSTLLMLPAIGGVVQIKDGRFSPHPIAEGLAGKQLQSVFVDPDGAVWVGMEGGRVRRWQDGKISEFGPANGLNRGAVVSFAADNEGRVWIVSGDFLGYYLEGKLTPITNSLDPAEDTAVTASRSGGIWICRDARLLKLVGGQLVTISTNLPWANLGGVVREMYEDSHHALWIGTVAHGLFRFADGKFTREETSQSQITSITEDSEGGIWAGTVGGGINRLRPKLFHLYNASSGLPQDVCDSLCTDDRGTIWLANRRSGVVRITDGKVFDLEPHGPLDVPAFTICVDDQRWVWASAEALYRFAPDNPGQIYTVSNGLTGTITGVRVLSKTRQGDIWVGADPALVGCFRGGQPKNYVSLMNFPGQHPRSITEDARGDIWIGTQDGQLYQLANGKFTEFTQTNGLPDAPIQSLYADDDGSVWIGTGGGGLVLWRDGKFTLISVADGLPGNNIAEMVEDNAGQLWLGSQRGIFHLAKRNLLDFADGKIPKVTGIPFGHDEGLDDVSCIGSSQPKACKTPDGRLWFATQQGVLSVNAPAISFNSRPPPVFIDKVLVNDRPLEMNDPLRVSSLCRKMEFQFSTLSYNAPDEIHLRYKLDGVDSDWVEMVNQREAVYSNLRPGKYRLHLKACNAVGVWNDDETSLSFVVLPAWWQNRWFRGSTLLLLLAASAFGVRYWSQRRLKLELASLERQEVLEKERARIARDLHDDLGATVTQVGLMMEELRAAPFSEEEIQKQSAAISGRVLNLARDLDAVVWSVNPGKDSLAELFVYLGQFFLECFRRTSIRPRLEMADIVPNVTLAPEARHHLFMVVKEAMNNIIKHSKAAEVTLTLKVVANSVEIRIKDDGCGISPGKIAGSNRHGFQNMQSRIEQLGGKLEVSSEPGKGTSIRILISSWKNLRAESHRSQ